MLGGKIIVMLGFAILLPLLTYAGDGSINPGPKMQDFVHLTPFVPGVKLTPEEQTARTNEVKEQTRQFQIANSKFAFEFIMVMSAIGIIEIIIGAYIGLPGIASGLIIAGIITIIWSNFNFYAVAPPILHFGSYLMGFLGVLLVGIRMMRKTEKPTASQD